MRAAQEATEESKRTIAVFREEDEMQFMEFLRVMNCCITRGSWTIKIQIKGEGPYGINFVLKTTLRRLPVRGESRARGQYICIWQDHTYKIRPLHR